jgi:hypothetical protein
MIKRLSVCARNFRDSGRSSTRAPATVASGRSRDRGLSACSRHRRLSAPQESHQRHLGINHGLRRHANRLLKLQNDGSKISPAPAGNSRSTYGQACAYPSRCPGVGIVTDESQRGGVGKQNDNLCVPLTSERCQSRPLRRNFTVAPAPRTPTSTPEHRKHQYE